MFEAQRGAEEEGGLIQVEKLSSNASVASMDKADASDRSYVDKENKSQASNAMEGAGSGRESGLISDRSMDPGFVISRANEKIQKIDNFKKKANSILTEVREKLDKLDQLVRENTNDGVNLEGFLLGKSSEYKVILDREDFDLRTGLDKELWQAQIKNALETKKQAEKVGTYLKQSKRELTELMRP